MTGNITPETDAVLERLVKNQVGNSCDAVVIHHARKLEKERDEAREIAKEAINGLYNLGDYDLANRLASNLEETK